MPKYDMVTEDNKVKLLITCRKVVDGEPMDLTGYTATLRWKSQIGLTEDRTMVIEDVIGGQVSYSFLEGEIEAPAMQYEVTLTKASDGQILTSLKAAILGVRERL